jgi:23S rRNA (cytidine1920-2'-O)/16S rRNA (cytidine1409-2'-O)-methyltransferase
MAKARLDQLLVDGGHAESKTKAQAIILAGTVYVRGQKVDKPGTLVAEDAEIEVRGEKLPYVSRGGVKLAGALDGFAVDPRGLRCLDVGASTGGFTDCLLQRGATHVVAVDVGYGQLAQKLRDDPRVTNLERTNARTLEPSQIGGVADLTVVDASFIGLGKLAEAIARCTREGGTLVALIKPQFEVGRAEASRGRGVVRDEGVRAEAIADARASLESHGFVVRAEADCVIAGPKGNREAFVLATREGPRLESVGDPSLRSG